MKAPLSAFRQLATYGAPFSPRWQKASGQAQSTLVAERLVDVQLTQPRRLFLMLRTDGAAPGDGSWIIEAGSAYALVQWVIAPSTTGRDFIEVAGCEVRVSWQPGPTPVAGTAEASVGVS